ncbi:sulfur carrier protein ThiS adenylyltransferase ThiF [bacterium]|nr:sulfur carrier protein ThiS adenylyltransferase ThiF [bacterium]
MTENSIFSRNVDGMTEILTRSCIGIAGCGGLGSNAAVALVRAGIGKLILVDFDNVEMSNLNRQYFFVNQVGTKKVEALAANLKSINPRVELEIFNVKIDPESIQELFGSADLLIEAFDKAESKKWLIENWSINNPNKPVISGNGVSGIGNNESLTTTKMGNIYFCGDGVSDLTMGLCGARVAIVANMQANLAIELLVSEN